MAASFGRKYHACSESSKATGERHNLFLVAQVRLLKGKGKKSTAAVAAPTL